MSDDFFLSGLDGGWFSNRFDDYVLLGYVGDKARIDAELQNKSMLWKAAALIAPKLRVGSLVKLFTGFDLGKAATDPSLVTSLFNLVSAEEKRRTLTQILAYTYKRERRRGLYFEGFGKAFIFRK